ncbi:MAG: hypothetical protein EPN36_14170 [Rhodanobacteraceae bacterium]|nr:MAG: hypothetical protein EPN36_14170 [Rhodanobacteraceae bacterium]
MKTNLYTHRNFTRFMVGTALALIATASQAQAFGSNIGAGLMQGLCNFTHSPIIAFAAAAAIIIVAFLLIMNEGKGLGGFVVRIAIGIAIVLSIGTILGWLGLTTAIGC